MCSRVCLAEQGPVLLLLLPSEQHAKAFHLKAICRHQKEKKGVKEHAFTFSYIPSGRYSTYFPPTTFKVAIFFFRIFSPGREDLGQFYGGLSPNEGGRRKGREEKGEKYGKLQEVSSSSSGKKIYKVGHLENMASFFTPFFARRKFRKNLCCLFLFHNLIVRETLKKTEEEQLVLCLSTGHWRNRRKSRDSPRFTYKNERSKWETWHFKKILVEKTDITGS